jgi:hypothetical protein
MADVMVLSPLITGMAPGLDRLHTFQTRMQPAVSTFPDEPGGTPVADVTGPLDQRIVRLDQWP